MGMLINFSVFGISDIMEFLENENVLKERIEKAKEFILFKVMDYIYIVLNIFFSKYRKHSIPSPWSQILPK